MYLALTSTAHLTWAFRRNQPDGARTGSYTSCMKLTAAVTHEDPWYVARCLEIEVASQGKTPEEALENLKEALELYFEDVEPPKKLEPPIISTDHAS